MIPRLKVSINLMNTLGEALPFLTDARVLGSASLRFRAVPEPRVGSHPGGRSCALYLRLQPGSHAAASATCALRASSSRTHRNQNAKALQSTEERRKYAVVLS